MNPRIFISFIGLISGILAGSGLLSGGAPGPVRLIVVLISPAVFLIWLLTILKQAGWFGSWRILFFICFFGIGYVSVFTNRFSIAADSRSLVQIIGKVRSAKQVSDKMIQVVIKPLFINLDSAWLRSRGSIVLLARPESDTVRSGEIRQFGPIRISRTSSKPGNGGFVPSRYWRSRGVEYEAWIYPGQSRLLRPAPGHRLSERLERWQTFLVGKIAEMELSETSRGLLAAMIFGDRGQLEDDVVQSFSRAGIVHVLSVSGLHVGIIYLVFSFLLGRIPWVPAYVRPILSVFLVWTYTGVSGFSNSACRAAGMISLFAASRITFRTNRGLDILAAVALIQCMINPFLIFSAGAQLSYLAVAGIFIWMPVFTKRIKGSLVKRKILESAAVSVAAQSLLVPVLVFWFGWVPVYFLIGNMVLMPLLVFSFYSGLALVVVYMAGFSIPPACALVDLVVAGSLKGAEWLGSLPGSMFDPGRVNLTDMLVYYGVLLMARLYADNPSPVLLRRFLLLTGLMIGLSVAAGAVLRWI